MILEALAAFAGGLPDPPRPDVIPLPLTRLNQVSLFDALLNYPPVKALIPIPILIALAPLVIWFFRKTWELLDAEARADWTHAPASPPEMQGPMQRRRRWVDRVRRGSATTRATTRVWRKRAPTPELGQPRASSRQHGRQRLRAISPGRAAPRPSGDPGTRSGPNAGARTRYDFRPAACLVIVAIVLTLQEYYGGRRFYTEMLRPVLIDWQASGWTFLQVEKFDELWSYAWWSSARAIGYVLVPFPLWKLLFPKDSLLDMGLRVRGFFQHAWIYLLCLAFVLPAMVLVASQPDFGTYYPFYKQCSRSYMDLVAWELMYWIQFLTLEMFFRGWMLGALRKSIGSAAIFVMAVPYCMIHYGKPYLEANGAIVAGIVLGSLAMHTRSIYAGFLVHITVAFLMDFLALWKRGALPTELWPG